MLQSVINSISQFVRVIIKILEEYISHRALPFLNDIEIKSLKSRYNNEEKPDLPGVRKFVLKHIQNLNKVLTDIERAGGVISAEKSKFNFAELIVIGYIYDNNKRHSEQVKIAKIVM